MSTSNTVTLDNTKKQYLVHDLGPEMELVNVSGRAAANMGVLNFFRGEGFYEPRQWKGKGGNACLTTEGSGAGGRPGVSGVLRGIQVTKCVLARV